VSSYVYLGVRTLAVIVLVAAFWPVLGDVYDGMLLGVASVFFPVGMAANAVSGQIYFDFSAVARQEEGMYVQGLLLALGLALSVALVICTPAMSILRRAVSLAAVLLLLFVLHVAGISLLARGLWLATQENSQTFTVGGVMTGFAIFWALLPAVLGGVWCYLYWLPHLKAVGKSPQRS